MTRRVDRFRPPYERRPMDFPRQCVFAGTVNLDTFFRDETGARRFWPVSCGSIDIQSLERARDQLWAEAKARYENREAWHLDDPELVQLAAAEQDERYEEDPWDSLIWDFVESASLTFSRGGRPVGAFIITIGEILGKVLQKPEASWQQTDKLRIGRILRKHGLEYKLCRVFDAAGEPVMRPSGDQKRCWAYRWP